jgi:hypothetical protein
VYRSCGFVLLFAPQISPFVFVFLFVMSVFAADNAIPNHLSTELEEISIIVNSRPPAPVTAPEASIPAAAVPRSEAQPQAPSRTLLSVWDVAKEALLTSASLIDGVATRASFGDVAQQVAQQEKLCDEVNVQIKSADADLVELVDRRLATYQARESMLAEMLVSVTEVTADSDRLLQFKQVRATLEGALLDNGIGAQPAATEIAVDESTCPFKKAHVRLQRSMVEVQASACDMLQVLAVEEEKCANCVVHRSALEERLDLVRAVIASHAQVNVLRVLLQAPPCDEQLVRRTRGC